MKYYEIIRILTEEPLLITPTAHASILQLFNEHRSLDAIEFRSKREGVDYCGEEVELEQMEVINGIAYIPISGPIGRGFGKFEKGAGAVDVSDVASELREADGRADVRGIILDIDSPGGMVNGTPELADKVAGVSKPIFAFTAGNMCSAAYWIGASANQVFATKSANVGSIGVYSPFLDSSKRMADEGLKVEVISSGKYKALGLPGTSLTEAHREFLQTRVDEIADQFQSHIRERRGGNVSKADMQGQVFMAPAALTKGFIDQIVADKVEVAAML